MLEVVEVTVKIPRGEFCQVHKAATKEYPYAFEGHYRCPLIVLRRCPLCKGEILPEADYNRTKILTYRILKHPDCPSLKKVGVGAKGDGYVRA